MSEISLGNGGAGRRLLLLFVASVVLLIGSLPSVVAAAESPVVVELTIFWGDGCPHCAAEHRFLDELQVTRPGLVVIEYEVWKNEGNRELFREMAEAAGIEARAVPTTFVGDRVWIGFDDVVADEITAVVDALLAGETVPDTERTTVDVPLIGPVDLGGRSLVASTLLIGFVDGINPCSLWVLSILLAVVLHSGSRQRVMAVGSVFLFVTSAMYGLYIVGFYSALTYAGYLPWIQRGVAVMAGTLGLLQLNEVYSVRRAPALGISESAKPGLYRRMRRLADPERSLTATLGGTAALAVGVSLLETPCTLGLPILWTDMLARRDVPMAGAAVLFVLYLAAFLIDELLLFGAAVVTMRAAKLQEHHGRELKIVSGVVMLTLAAVMIGRPATMESLGGALGVFAVAAFIATAGLLTDRLLRTHAERPHRPV